MKKLILNISVVALIFGGLTSCDSELNQIPFDQAGTETAYETAADLENAIRGVYLVLSSGSLWGGSDAGGMYDAPDVLADNVTFAQDGRHSRQNMHNWNFGTANAPMSGLYYAVYQLTYHANLLLENMVDFEGESKENIMAEARALRGYAHLMAVSYYGKIPTQGGDANGSLGIPYVTEANPNIQPARLTVGETYAKIIEDLEFAAANINATNPAGRMGKDGVNVLLSRAYLYMGEYQKAAAAAGNVTKPVTPRGSMVDVWEDQNRDGLLLYIENEDTGIGGISVGVTWSQGSAAALRPEYVISYDFYNMFTNDDIRKEAFTMEANGYNAVKKLFGRPGQSNGKVDLKIIRSDEAYLNRAEALATDQGGDLNAAKAALKQILNERYTNPVNIDGYDRAQLLQEIRLQRRLEFAFEGQRFFDLKRWNQGINRDGHGDLGDGSGTPSESQNLEAGSHKFQLPFSQAIIDRNNAMVQNPGY